MKTALRQLTIWGAGILLYGALVQYFNVVPLMYLASIYIMYAGDSTWKLLAFIDIVHGLVHIVWPFIDGIVGFNRTFDPTVDLLVHTCQQLIVYGLNDRELFPKRVSFWIIIMTLVSACLGTIQMTSDYYHSIFSWITIFPTICSSNIASFSLSRKLNDEETNKLNRIQIVYTIGMWSVFKIYHYLTKFTASGRFFESYFMLSTIVGYYL